MWFSIKTLNQLQLYTSKVSDNKKPTVFISSSSDTVDEDDDFYDFVEDEENEGDDIYEDLMKTGEPPENVSDSSKRFNFYWIKMAFSILFIISSDDLNLWLPDLTFGII